MFQYSVTQIVYFRRQKCLQIFSQLKPGLSQPYKCETHTFIAAVTFQLFWQKAHVHIEALCKCNHTKPTLYCPLVNDTAKAKPKLFHSNNPTDQMLIQRQTTSVCYLAPRKQNGNRSQHAAQEQRSSEQYLTGNVPRGKGPKFCTLPLLMREIQVQADFNHTL